MVVPIEGEGGPRLHLTVYLESGSRLDVVRDEVIRPVGPAATAEDLIWQADQLTQETIGVDLAELGWEAIGAGDLPAPEPGALARSASYGVRNLGYG